ncbi:hypothetical protein [Oxobacter pfennigii]|uniref:hypothetical protein n=1 Tax=Oxobacter pfennigii TaxID=36849 RepID=UPI001364990E|nr:hypothetical protein [Oxobacter pfennigii]
MIFIICLMIISFFQIKAMWGKVNPGTVAVYGLLMTTAAVIGSLLISGVELPSHNEYISKFFEPIGKTLLGK